MERITKREKMIYATFISLIVSILLLYVVTDIYANYSDTFEGNGTLAMATRWLFTVNNVNNKDTKEFSFDIINSDRGNSEVAPGEKGYFEIKLKNESNVPAKYSINLREDLYGNIGNNVEYIKLYKDKGLTQVIDMYEQNLEGQIDKDSEYTVKVYWKWIEQGINKDGENIDYKIQDNYDGFKIYSTVTATAIEVLDKTKTGDYEIVAK